MRARMALYGSGMRCELREVFLRHKPQAMLDLSPKGTVPVLLTQDGVVIDESLDLMIWALRQNDPEQWLTPDQETLKDSLLLVAQNDTQFKPHLDHYKYPTRYEDIDPIDQRGQAEKFLELLEEKLTGQSYLFGDRLSLSDAAIAPFIRQFAHVDKAWFDQTPYPNLQGWLETILNSALFTAVMEKYKPWQEGDAPIFFGA